MNERFETFTVLISKISRNIRRIKNQEMAEYDLRSAHISCLYYLYGTDSMTATDICEKSDEDKATISRSLDYLEKNGYIACDTKRAKRYKSPIILTDKGIEVGERITEKVNRVMDEISGELTEKERKDLYRSLGIISDRLDDIGSRLDERSSIRK